jgi:hypothetical protein
MHARRALPLKCCYKPVITYFKAYSDAEQSLTCPSEKFAAITLMESMMAEVAHLNTAALIDCRSAVNILCTLQLTTLAQQHSSSGSTTLQYLVGVLLWKRVVY